MAPFFTAEELMLVNAQGQMVGKWPIDNNRSSSELDVRHLPRGVYILYLINGAKQKQPITHFSNNFRDAKNCPYCLVLSVLWDRLN